MFVSKTIKAELFGLIRTKLDKLQDLQVEWEKALGLEKDYKRLRSQTRLPSYYCKALGEGTAWSTTTSTERQLGERYLDYWLEDGAVGLSAL